MPFEIDVLSRVCAGLSGSGSRASQSASVRMTQLSRYADKVLQGRAAACGVAAEALASPQGAEGPPVSRALAGRAGRPAARAGPGRAGPRRRYKTTDTDGAHAF